MWYRIRSNCCERVLNCEIWMLSDPNAEWNPVHFERGDSRPVQREHEKSNHESTKNKPGPPSGTAARADICCIRLQTHFSTWFTQDGIFQQLLILFRHSSWCGCRESHPDGGRAQALSLARRHSAVKPQPRN